MQLTHLQTFTCVVESGSLSRAARRLHYSQPTVTAQMHALERRLGTALLERTPAGVSPTPAGRQVYGGALAILELVELLQRNVADVLVAIAEADNQQCANPLPRRLSTVHRDGAPDNREPLSEREPTMTCTAATPTPTDLMLRGMLTAQSEVQTRAEALADGLRRAYAQSRVVWFAIILPIAIFLGLALFAYLTVQCWNRGYRGFSGLVDWHFTSWTHFFINVHFACF